MNDRPQQLMGEQNVLPMTLYGYKIPITYTDGLPHIKTTYATDEEMSTLPKIVMDPQRYDEPATGRVSMGLTNEPGYYLYDDVERTGEMLRDRLDVIIPAP